MPENSTHERKIPGFLDNLLGRFATCSLIIIPIFAVFKFKFYQPQVFLKHHSKVLWSLWGDASYPQSQTEQSHLEFTSADPNWSIVFQRQWKCLLLPWLLKNPLKWQPWLSWFLGSSWVPWSWSRDFKVFVGCSKQGRCYEDILIIVENRGYFSDNCRLKAARIDKGLTALCLEVKSA